ncbi:PREDICTED: uncharacterized protein LOC105314133 [Amphimedon queenslandica]|uniref:Uncharacterized protein n=1 Tax=Amphimedon queenslandica TaxID=400682 RepID=A0AAN0IPD3_AMPQE|nr:PREDICTED: uncharacterized protein LOC105314133 [Amphimedon queenslandica]|eukprot:XP_011406408.1 PREDICTED: uncharacterized protein LOC105314133 [Amphimedon queenslandica]
MASKNQLDERAAHCTVSVDDSLYVWAGYQDGLPGFWQCIKKPEAIDQWPVGRNRHAGAIIITGSDCPMLVISGGFDKNIDTLDDCWIFNITQHSWIKLDVPHSVSKRRSHSLSVFIMSPHCVWIITAGGAVMTETLVTNPNIVMLTELVLYDSNTFVGSDFLKCKEYYL